MCRITELRQAALETEICYDEFFYNFYKFCSGKDFVSDMKLYGDAFYFAFSSLTPNISDDELIVGKSINKLPFDAKNEWEETYLLIAKETVARAGNGQDSHMAIDYELVLNCGLNGIIKKIDGYLSECDESKKDFYSVCKKCLEAVIMLSERYADKAAASAQTETDQVRRDELEKISEICKKVPKNPAESFYEAVQSVHFVTYCLSMNPLRLCHQQFQLGHPDRYLLPYYLKDIENGIITKDYAQLLLNCLGIQINNRVPNGLSSGYMLGGRDENGNIVSNDLTIMCMQVVDAIRLVYPAVGLCYTDGMDDMYIEKACEILSHGCSHPAIFNDDIITKGLMSYGLPEAEARNYIHSTCVEITPVASSNVWVASPYTNMPQLLLDVMNKEYDCFDELLSAFFANLDATIKRNFESENATRKKRFENSVNPLLSCFVKDCLKCGKDIEHGGARYNWIMPSFVGMANLVDSLYVLKELIFDKKEYSVAEIKSVLDNNFSGFEVLQNRILKNIPKYGNDIDEVDLYFGIVTEHIISECKKYKGIFKNGNIIPSVFCWIMHERFGRETGATPDGRKAGFPLGDGSGPCQGRELKGPTASILSSTKWAHRELIGGVAVNMKFSKNSLGDHSIGTMKVLIKTFLKRGGFEVQINVVDGETLKKAVLNPEQFRDLVVRIGGYSDYFVKLSPQMQQEVIMRTEHKI